MVWIMHFFGLDDPSGPVYLFWSGIGADLSELAIIGGLINLARRHNCEIHRCWRVGRHQVDGTAHVVCRRHHPHGPLRPHHLPTEGRPPVNRTRRAQVVREKDGWWQWDCGWSGCTAAEQERTQAAAINAVTRHSHRHLSFGFRLATKNASKEASRPRG